MFIGDFEAAEFGRRRGSRDKKKRIRRALAIGATAAGGTVLGAYAGVRIGALAGALIGVKRSNKVLQPKYNQLSYVAGKMRGQGIGEDQINAVMQKGYQLIAPERDKIVWNAAYRGGKIGAAVLGTYGGYQTARVVMRRQAEEDRQKARRR